MRTFAASLVILAVVSAEVFNADEWKEVKSPLDSPRYQLILSKIFPEAPFAGKTNRGGRIAGGALAKLGQFPYQALLLTRDQFGDEYVCGGGIISHNFILTAAHCLDDIVKVSVYVGITDRVNGPAIWGIDITDKSAFIVHEGYNRAGVYNDIAIVRLVNTIKNDPNVGIVQLPSRSDGSAQLVGKLATISGFGRTTDVSGPSQHLRWIQSPIVGNEVCEKVFGKANVRDTNICLETTGGKSSCQGDSGGPLTVELNGRRIVAGVVSYGAAVSCTSGYPAVFTRVTSYLDWIKAKTGIQIN